jgi:hypothetical protein
MTNTAIYISNLLYISNITKLNDKSPSHCHDVTLLHGHTVTVTVTVTVTSLSLSRSVTLSLSLSHCHCEERIVEF